MGGKEKTRICKQYSTKKIEDWESWTKKSREKLCFTWAFLLIFLERGTFTEYPYKGKVMFYKVNADKEKDLCNHFGVQALPTLFFIPAGGKPIIEVGATPEKYVQIIEEQLLK